MSGVLRTGGHYLSIAEVAYPPLLRLFFATGPFSVSCWVCESTIS